MDNGKNGRMSFIWVKIILAIFLVVMAAALLKQYVFDNPVEDKALVIVGCAIMGIVGVIFGFSAMREVSNNREMARRNMHVNAFRPDSADRAAARRQQRSGKKKKRR